MNPSADILCDQELNAFAPISEFVSADEYGYAVVNMQPAYKNYVNNAIRGAYLDKKTGAMIVQDEISFKNTGNELYWFMHTKADVTLAADGKSAILSQNGKRIWVGILSEGNEVFSEPVNNEDNAKPLSTSPDPNTLSQNQANQPPNPKTQNTNDGIRKLVLHQTGVGGEYRLTVALIPLKSGQTEPTVLPQVNPINKWEN